MQKFIEFFELDKDGTWFVVLIFILTVVVISLLIHYGRQAIEDIHFYHKYGMTLSKYCFINEISDRDWAKEVARRELESSKIVERLNATSDFYIPDTGITMEQACENMRELVDVMKNADKIGVYLTPNDAREMVGLPKINGGL